MPKPKGHKEGCQCVVCRRIDAALKSTVEPIPASFSFRQQVQTTGYVKGIPIGTAVVIDGMSTPRGRYKIIFRNRRCWVDGNLLRSR